MRQKTQHLSIPYKAITSFSVESAGTFDMDSELNIWISGQGTPITRTLKKGTDVLAIQAMLTIPADFYFQFGLLAFLLGHSAYCIAFGFHCIQTSGLICGICTAPLLTLAFSWWLLPHINGDIKIPVIAYMLVITTMVILALGAYAKGAPNHITLGEFLFFFLTSPWPLINLLAQKSLASSGDFPYTILDNSFWLIVQHI